MKIRNEKHKASNHSAEAQKFRVWERLKLGAASTPQLRHEEDVPAPAPRVHSLRHEHNLNIQTFWVTADNPGGGRHRFAQYVLMPGKWQGGAK